MVDALGTEVLGDSVEVLISVSSVLPLIVVDEWESYSDGDVEADT